MHNITNISLNFTHISLNFAHISLNLPYDSVLGKESTPGVVTPSKRVGVSRSRTFGESAQPCLPIHRVNRVPPPPAAEDEWMRRADAEANAAAFYYHQQQSAEDYVLTDDEVITIHVFQFLCTPEHTVYL